MLELTIETGSAAFEEYPTHELARILRRLAQRLELPMSAGPQPAEDFKLYDINGNQVGAAIYRPEEG